MNPSFGVPFGQRPLPPLTNFQKEALTRWSGNSGMPSPWMEDHAKSSESVTVLGPFDADEMDTSEPEDDGAEGGAASGAGVEGTSGRSDGKVLVRFALTEEQPQGEKEICRALGLVRERPSKTKVASVKPGSILAKWGVEAGSDIVELRGDCAIIAMKSVPVVPKSAPTAAQRTASRDQAQTRASPMSPESRMDAIASKEEVPVPVRLEVEMIYEALTTLSLEEKNGSSVVSITNKVNASADPPYTFTPQQILKVVRKGIGSAKILKANGVYKLNPEAPAFPAIIEDRGGMISVGSKRSDSTMQQLLWCLNLSSNGARAVKNKADLRRPPSHDRAWAWEGLADEQHKSLGIQTKDVHLRTGKRFIEVEDVIDGSVADRHGVRPGDVIEAVGGRPVVDISKTRFVLALAHALFDPEDQNNVWLRVLLLRKKPVTATAAAAAPAAATAQSGEGQGMGALDGASSTGWVSEKAAAASRRGSAGNGKGGERVGGLGISSSGAVAAAASTQEGEAPKGKGKGKGNGARRILGGGSGGEPMPSPAAAETSTCGRRNLPFRPQAAAAGQEEGDEAGNGNVTRQRWDEANPLDAVPPEDPARSAAQSSARSFRKEHRGGRAVWWEPRAPGATTSVLKLRPANQMPGKEPPGGEEGAERGVEESKGGGATQQQSSRGEAVPPGAFLLEGLTVGTGRNRGIIPAGAQLVGVDGIDCRNLPFEEVRRMAMSATSGSPLVFDDV